MRNQLRFNSRPYRLINKIQHYDWGTRNENAFIPRFIGIETELNKSYAELWIGAHPKASSEIEIDNERFSLHEVIKNYPTECLGEKVAHEFNNELPFLLKVLSAGQALSIQTHPNKEQAKRLHRVDPVNYPDENHKPEIAIAIDSLSAIAGFRPLNEIAANLKRMPEIEKLVGASLLERAFSQTDENELRETVKLIYTTIMRSSSENYLLQECVSQIKNRLITQTELSKVEEQFMIQYNLYGADVGLFSFLFFNLIELGPMHAIFTDAGVPHAYLKGNIVECMANSDNVIRAGLTNKYKDIEALLEIVNYDFKEYEILNKNMDMNFVYESGAKEFKVTSYSYSEEITRNYLPRESPVVILLMEGEIILTWNENTISKSERFYKGESLFIPAGMTELQLNCMTGSKYFMVEVPHTFK